MIGFFFLLLSLADVIFEMMVLACVIDGTVGPRELRLLRRAREVMRPMAPCLLTEEARASEDARAAHEAAVDSRIEERVCTWAKTIRNATSTFVSASCELIPSMHGRARARARVRRVSVRVARIARLLLLNTNPPTVRKRRSR
jgi:orotidine-5'-phosphate decarboxylase